MKETTRLEARWSLWSHEAMRPARFTSGCRYEDRGRRDRFPCHCRGSWPWWRRRSSWRPRRPGHRRSYVIGVRGDGHGTVFTVIGQALGQHRCGRAIGVIGDGIAIGVVGDGHRSGARCGRRMGADGGGAARGIVQVPAAACRNPRTGPSCRSCCRRRHNQSYGPRAPTAPEMRSARIRRLRLSYV